MTDTEAEQILVALAAGATICVPFTTKLYPDTRAEETKVQQLEDDVFEVVTSFNEFWAGHGWSLTQTEREVWPRDRLLDALRGTESTACTRAPR